jgi:hypothetical protein
MAMLIGNVRPTTLDGVKSLAAQLRREQRIKHATALDLAAKAANCKNFRHARRVLPTRRTEVAAPYVLLTIYWYDKKQQYQRGRETLRIELPRPILNICGKSALKHVRGFGDLRMVADDHFVCDTLADTQAHARDRLCTAERSLRFVEHTGLLPSREYRKAYQNRWRDDGLPNRDHPTYWVDSASRQFILVDEPYSGVPDEAKRAAWASRTGWLVVKTSWPGMYNPYNCDLYVATSGGSSYDLDALVAKINAMPAPLLAEEWHGQSSPSWEIFLSPMAQTTQDKRRARCRGTIYPVSNSTTVPYSYDPGSLSRRPAAKMTVEEHIEAGRIIKAVLHSNQSTYAVYNRMNSLRSTLEDWMCLEIDRRQLDRIDFFEVYYREAEGDAPYDEMAKSRGGVIKMLGDLKQKLQAAYPDCAPLRKQIHRIDISISMLGKIKPAE